MSTKRWKVERFSRENNAPWAEVGWNVYSVGGPWEPDTWLSECGDFDEWADALAFAFEQARAEASR